MAEEEARPDLERSASSEFFGRNRKTNGVGVQVGDEVQICVVMVGLPARGKSLIAQKSESLCQPQGRSIRG